MNEWRCGIDSCERSFGAVGALVEHQVGDHADVKCPICGAITSDGFPAILHVVEDHRRSEYVRAFAADPADIRQRERLVEVIKATYSESEILDWMSTPTGQNGE